MGAANSVHPFLDGLAWLLRRTWCVVVGHCLDAHSVNSQPYVIRRCTRCNGDVYQRLG